MISLDSASRLASSLLLLAAVIVYWPDDQVKELRNPRPLEMPARLGDWSCITNAGLPSSAAPYDFVWTGECSNGPLGNADVQVIYLAQQTKNRRLSSPALDFAGNLLRSEKVLLEVEGGRFPVIQMVGQRSSGVSESALYWYELEGESFANDYWLRAVRLMRTLVGRGTSGVSVRISSKLDDQHGDSIREMQRALARTLWSHLRDNRIPFTQE